jgi:predicted permease
MISYRFWQRRFGGAATVIGTTLPVEGVPFTIVGVTPPRFLGPDVGQAYGVVLPLAAEVLIRGASAALNQPRALFLSVMLRLRPDQSLEAGTAAIRSLQPEIVGVMAAPPPFLREPFTLVPAATGISDRSGLRQRYGRPLLAIFIIVGVVLLVACVNIANLLLARAATRRHEMSVRRALGAPPGRLARQLLVESLVLAGLGAAGGLLVAAWGSRALVAQLATADAPVTLDLSLDWRVLAFAGTATIATAALFGAAPARRAARVAPIEALKRQAYGEGRRGRLSGGLVVAQVGLSLALVVVAGLFVRTFTGLATVPLGFDADRVLLVEVDAAGAQVEPTNRSDSFRQLASAVAAVPGVARASASMWIPGGSGAANLMRDARGRAIDADRRVLANFVAPGWFATYGIPLHAGRDVAGADTAESRPVAVVSEALARRDFPGRSPIGETFDDDSITAFLAGRTVVGVVGDAIYGSVRDAALPTVYLPLAQAAGLGPPDRTSITLSARSIAGSPIALAPSVAAALAAVDDRLTFGVRPLADDVHALLLQERLLARLSAVLGALALLLAGIGLYGVLAYAVSRRRTEIAIRLALGAPRADVLGQVLREGLRLAAMGIGLGLAGAAAVTRSLEALLFGLTPLDPATFLGASAVFAVVALVASYVPAHRATTVDPLVALRDE